MALCVCVGVPALAALGTVTLSPEPSVTLSPESGISLQDQLPAAGQVPPEPPV